MILGRLLTAMAFRVVLTLAGLGALCVSAFLVSEVAGWAAIGISLLLTEWAMSREASVPPR